LHDCRQNIMRIPFLKLPAALIPTLTSRRNAMPKVKRAILCPGSFIVVILMVNEARSCNEHARTSKRTNRSCQLCCVTHYYHCATRPMSRFHFLPNARASICEYFAYYTPVRYVDRVQSAVEEF